MGKRNKSVKLTVAQPDYSLLVNMLRYKRPEGSLSQELFCQTFIGPLMGFSDINGNYCLSIGESPKVLFTAHHDTVHKVEGIQNVYVKNGIVTSDSNCLGADCTAGVFLILEMIKANVSGVYCIFAGEELGCIGSRTMAETEPQWLDSIDYCISFDRKGYNSIITHQLGFRTCSDDFADSLASILSSPNLVSDTTGAYTDSNEFIGLVSECTNLSVGYFGQHSSKETQDLAFVYDLKNRLISADWTQLVSVRVPALDDYEDYIFDWAKDYGQRKSDGKSSARGMTQLVKNYPEEIADLLEQWGMTFETLRDEIEGGVYGPNSGPDRWKECL